MLVKTYHNRFKLEYALKGNQPTWLVLTYMLSGQEKTAELRFYGAKNTLFKVIILVYLKNKSRFKLVTWQNHQQPLGYSNLLCKTVLNDSSSCHYLGQIKIATKGQNTHASLRNENLLLDDASTVISQPNLEIIANQVFCTHAAFTKSLEPQLIFYLQTRGLSETRARKLLAKGFLLAAFDSMINQPGFKAKSLKDLQKATLNSLNLNC